jgi:hypothetical protein
MSTPENKLQLDKLITEYIKLVDLASDEPDPEMDARMASLYSQINDLDGEDGLNMLLLRLMSE